MSCFPEIVKVRFWEELWNEILCWNFENRLWIIFSFWIGPSLNGCFRWCWLLFEIHNLYRCSVTVSPCVWGFDYLKLANTTGHRNLVFWLGCLPSLGYSEWVLLKAMLLWDKCTGVRERRLNFMPAVIREIVRVIVREIVVRTVGTWEWDRSGLIFLINALPLLRRNFTLFSSKLWGHSPSQKAHFFYSWI